MSAANQTQPSTATPAGKRANLGRGLSALFGDEAEETAPSGSGARATSTLPVELLKPGPYQPRKAFDPVQIEELARSIGENGILQPLIVRPDPERAGSYEIVAGERRWRAAQQARLHEVPVLIKDLSDQATLEIALIENLQRQDLNALEEGEGYKRLMEQFGYTQEDLSKRVGKSRSHVANTLRLLNLPDGVRRLIEDGRLSAGHARALLNVAQPEAMAKDVLSRGLSVRQTEKLVATRKDDDGGARRGRPPKDADTAALEREVSAQLGLKVTISARGERGSLTVHYDSLEQLDDLLARISG